VSDYNERLFNTSRLRYFYHDARFRWAAKRLTHDYKTCSLFELGCFDGRFLTTVKEHVDRYFGMDADWEGGLSQAKARYNLENRYTFKQSVNPADLSVLKDNSYDCAVSLETLEHIDPELLPAYISEIARIVRGHFYVSVPNEKGLMLLIKHLAKVITGVPTDEYTISEFWSAVLGKMDKVGRLEHKGFDHDALRKLLSEHFIIEQKIALPFSRLPTMFGATIAIVCRSK
jgi:2-polyprenyl-3-methyl-5-hydroxy-6-metoxy-1,4-benzoquinol methylase